MGNTVYTFEQRVTKKFVWVMSIAALDAYRYPETVMTLEGTGDMSNDRAEVGRRLVARRRARGWTQGDLVSATGISRKTVYSIEHGDEGVGRDKLLLVCDALGVNEDGHDEAGDGPRPDDTERMMRTLTRMPVEVRVAMIVYGGYLMKLSPADRSAEIDRMMLRSMEG